MIFDRRVTQVSCLCATGAHPATENLRHHQDKQRAEPHAIVGASLMHGSPETRFCSIGIFVVRIATLISISRGSAASRVSNPSIKVSRKQFPQLQRRAQRNAEPECDLDKPSHTQSPGNKNFWIPSDKNTQPTISEPKVWLSEHCSVELWKNSFLISAPASSSPQRLLNLPAIPPSAPHLLFHSAFHHHRAKASVPE